MQEGATTDPLAVDSYTVKLAVAPAAGTRVYVTVSASRSQRDEENGVPGGDSMWVSTTAPSSFTHTITVDGAPTVVKDRAAVLVFDSTNWNSAQTVYVYGVDDTRPEGERTVTVNHGVAAVITDPTANTDATPGHDAVDTDNQNATIDTFNQVKVRNVEVRVIDNDQAGLIVTPTDGSTLVLEGSLTPDAGGFTAGIADSFNLKLAKPLTGSETVTVTLAVDPSQLALTGAGNTVTFNASNWNSGVNIGVRAVDDSVREDSKRSFIDMTTSSAALADYNGLKSQLAVKVYDNDNPGALIVESDGATRVVNDDPATAADESVSDNYSVRLTSAPTADVTLTIDTDGQVTTAPTSLTFTTSNWYIPQTVTVTGNPSYVPGSSGVDTTTQKVFAPRTHLLSNLGGPLSVVGSSLGERALTDAIVLPKELNAPLLGFPVGVQPDERDQIDTLNIFDDGSREDKGGTLGSTGLTGFGMAPDLSVGSNSFGEPSSFPGGISFGDSATGKSGIEVLNLLLGEGNDTLAITGTLQPADEGLVPNRGPARHGTITLVHGGGNLPVSNAPGAAIGGDTITVLGGGGAGSPLAIYGDTSQDGLWYSGDPERTGRTASEPWADVAIFGAKFHDQAGTADDAWRFPLANPFDFSGNDVIDAGALDAADMIGATTIGVTIYGGAGDDQILGSQVADHLAGGSGDDTIGGEQGDDHIYGDSGLNVDPITRTLMVVTNDLGVVVAAAPPRDTLLAGKDTINGNSGEDIIFGDHGVIDQDLPPSPGSLNEEFRSGAVRVDIGRIRQSDGMFVQVVTADTSEKLLSTTRVFDVRTVEPQNGDDDTIHGDSDSARIFGGNGDDTIIGDATEDLIFGDHGHLGYRADDNDLTTLDLVESIDAEFGGIDTISGA